MRRYSRNRSVFRCICGCVFISGEHIMTGWFWHVGFQIFVEILRGDVKYTTDHSDTLEKNLEIYIRELLPSVPLLPN